jgi:hypothetical protein
MYPTSYGFNTMPGGHLPASSAPMQPGQPQTSGALVPASVAQQQQQQPQQQQQGQPGQQMMYNPQQYAGMPGGQGAHYVSGAMNPQAMMAGGQAGMSAGAMST